MSIILSVGMGKNRMLPNVLTVTLAPIPNPAVWWIYRVGITSMTLYRRHLQKYSIVTAPLTHLPVTAEQDVEGTPTMCSFLLNTTTKPAHVVSIVGMVILPLIFKLMSELV